ncbi:MAG: serine hydrolase, partial [Chitinophagaceae bacterium]|nr:serine hydrolase [Chitinophagaceae bacterium]
DKLTDSFPSNIDSIALVNAVDNLFKEMDTANPNRTRALIIVFNNQIIAERYAPGFTKQTRLTGWSMTKSITSAIAGTLVKENKINIDNPAPVPEWKNSNDPRHSITVRHLLQQTTGLEFEEVYSKSSHATRMLCQKGDMGAYAASLPLKHPPGTLFHYSSGNTNILSRVIRQTVGDNNYHAYPYVQLFYKLGMYSVVLEPDASGTFVGSSYCFATARDWARFGLLYLHDGVFNQQQILPKGWVKQSVTPSGAAEEGEYGFQWWLNAGEKNNPENRWFSSLPPDMFFADGFEGQNVFIIPSKKLVVVRLGLTRKRQYGEEKLLEAVINTIN